LHFIDQVLPSLGETGVVSTTIGELLPGIATELNDDDLVAELKGRSIWATILRRAVEARERIPNENISFRINGRELTIRRRDVRAAIAKARRSGKPHNEARIIFVREMLGTLASQYEKVTGKALDQEDRAILIEDLRANILVRKSLNLAWFPISPKRLVDDLFAKPHRLAQAAPEFTPEELALLKREKYAPWTISDIPLIDEAAELLGTDNSVAQAEAQAQAAERQEALEYARETLAGGGGEAIAGALGFAMPVSAEMLADRFSASGPRVSAAERAAGDRAWTYGHIVVDEAQELSPMAWRALHRRVPTRSMTIVGDVAQTSALGGVRDWAASLDPLLGGSWRVSELTISYRTPAAVADAALRFAASAGLPATPMTAARDVPNALQFDKVSQADLPSEVAKQTVALAREYLDEAGAGQVAVIATPEQLGELRPTVEAALEAEQAAGLRFEPEQIAILTPRMAKGLEFDGVVLVEPAQIAAESASDLYVAMTRPTQRLVVVHADNLPDGLAPDGVASDGLAPSADI
jgi:DNA helicase IV